ncbi:uncharacterized protein LOC130717131 [Lotus japonicus]|uniref:uncharacterized protein LOC130717131 n=1 Tax=Lotus japonicus TaxID=34305 RepID=UPI0025882182|nr:uncharacterized protein LOC130717131 [Lotus japonicus]
MHHVRSVSARTVTHITFIHSFLFSFSFLPSHLSVNTLCHSSSFSFTTIMELLQPPPTFDSTCSTPYVSAPSSPAGFYYSAPASPMHFAAITSSSEFEFSARFGSAALASSGAMTSADELFLNGQIRPMKLSTHLERPQLLAPLLDLEGEEEDEEVVVRGRDLRLRDKSVRRRTRSMSPLRNDTPLEWAESEEPEDKPNQTNDNNVDSNNGCSSEILESSRDKVVDELGLGLALGLEQTPSVSASSSRSSSAGRSSKRWVFLKDFLRSKSEGRSNNKFWSTISFSPIKEKKNNHQNLQQHSKDNNKPSENQRNNGSSSTKGSSQGWAKKMTGKPTNGVGKRRVPASPHELLYKANRAQAEELRKKTFLPYRQGLFGCLGFSSKGYGAMSGFARALNPVSSR